MPEIPITFSTGEAEYCFMDLHRLFANTSYGQVLAPRVRFGRYRPESVSEDEWHQALGADVNNLEHMRLTYGLTRQFIRYQNMYGDDILCQEDQQDLLLAATSHDWAESVVGDVMFDLKTESIETQESSAMRRIIHEMFGNGGEVLPAHIEQVISDVVEDHDTRLGKMFRVIEQLGYLRTGLTAFEISLQDLAPDFQNGLQWASSNVLSNQIPALIKAARHYPAADIFLIENADLITEAFATIPLSLFGNYDPGEDQKNLDKWFSARETWQQSNYV